MNTLLTKVETALHGEEAGPSLEEIIGIAIGLMVATALFFFGRKLYDWVIEESNKVDEFVIGGDMKGEGDGSLGN